jgi:transcriptional regulator with XRE-family HTH domain
MPEQLRRRRRELGLSLKEVARRLDVHFTTVSSWERGRSEPGLDMLRRLARVYEVPVADLLGSGRATPPRRPFRSLSPGAADRLLKTLEELRLAASLGAELGREGALSELSDRTGITTGRLAALGRGQAAFRPSEVAALVREIGSAGSVSLSIADDSEDGSNGLESRLERFFLEGLRRYVAGVPDRSHQNETNDSTAS